MPFKFNPITGNLDLVNPTGTGGGGGGVTSVSVATLNGFAGNVVNPTTTPSIRVKTTVTGLLKGDGTAVSAAVAGTDYEVPLTFTTGVTRTLNTVTVDTTQNIAKLSNLTSNGFVKTSGGDGTLSIDTTSYQVAGSYLTSVTASSPIFSSGGLTPDISIQDAAADGSTKGAATFAAADFNSSSGLISIDYTNGQSSSGSTKGFLTSTDWTTFNNKQPAGNYITSLTGDVTASGPGSATATIANDSVTFSKMQNISTSRLLGRSTASSGDIEELTIGTGLSLSSGNLSSTITQYTDEMAQDAIGAALVDSGTVDFTYNDGANTITAIVIDDSVTFAKMQNISTNRLLGRGTASTGDIEQITLGVGLELSGTTVQTTNEVLPNIYSYIGL